jgi:hypothetical protein
MLNTLATFSAIVDHVHAKFPHLGPGGLTLMKVHPLLPSIVPPTSLSFAHTDARFLSRNLVRHGLQLRPRRLLL